MRRTKVVLIIVIVFILGICIGNARGYARGYDMGYTENSNVVESGVLADGPLPPGE